MKSILAASLSVRFRRDMHLTVVQIKGRPLFKGALLRVSILPPYLAPPGIEFNIPPNPYYTTLTYTIPAGSDSVQLAWYGPATYYPVGSIPEPSTWAMLLIGFAGLGFASYRRAHQKRGPATVCP
jgi:hypothetical protein